MDPIKPNYKEAQVQETSSKKLKTDLEEKIEFISEKSFQSDFHEMTKMELLIGTEETPILSLPQEIFHIIFNYLELSDISSILFVSKYFFNTSINSDVYKDQKTRYSNRLVKKIFDFEPDMWKEKSFIDEYSDALNNLDCLKIDLEDLEDSTFSEFMDFIQANCPNLKHVSIQSLTDEDIKYLPRGLKSLKIIASDKTFTGSGFKDLPPELQNLHCDDFKFSFTNDMLQYLPKTLERLALFYSKITDEEIQNLPRGLTCLNLSHGKSITGLGLSKLPPDLKKLDISYCSEITDDKLLLLPKGLTELNIGGCEKIKGTTFSSLPPGLRELEIAKCQMVKDTELKSLPRGLVRLNLSYNPKIKGTTFSSLPPGLEILKLCECTGIEGDALQSLPAGLKTLSLWDCSQLTDEMVKALTAQELEDLDLNECVKLTDNCFQFLPRKLKKLNISSCENINGQGFKDLPQELNDLSLHYFNNVGNDAIASLPDSLLRLQLFFCHKLTDKALSHLPKNLKYLDIERCENISEDWHKKLPEGVKSTYDLD